MTTKLLILQPTSLCNLNCSYCYVPERRDPQLMTDEVLESAVRCYFNSSFSEPQYPNSILRVLWHAGEPLAAPLHHYIRAIELFNKYNTQQRNILYAIQTNATLINQNWCDFFLTSKMEICVSIDGPQFINDRHRRNWNDKSAFNKAMRGIELLKKNNMPLQAIAVLTEYSLDYPDEIYQFFTAHGFESVGFNIDETEGDYTLSTFQKTDNPKQQQNIITRYEQFMQRLYDLWIADGRKIAIREFDTTLKLLALRKAGFNDLFAHDGALAFASITISRDGHITTFSPEIASGIANKLDYFSIGNVKDISSFDDCIQNSNFKQQLQQIAEGIKHCAKTCEYFDFCGGGCPSNKYYEHGSFASTETINCRLTVKSMTDLLIKNLS